MNAPVAKTCRQRRLFARFASVCALVVLALLLLPAAARAGKVPVYQRNVQKESQNNTAIRETCLLQFLKRRGIIPA